MNGRMKDLRPLSVRHREHMELNGHASLRCWTNISVPDPDDPAKMLGSVTIEACTECPKVTVQCNHDHATWTHLPIHFNARANLIVHWDPLTKEACTGCLLQCNLCGADAT